MESRGFRDLGSRGSREDGRNSRTSRSRGFSRILEDSRASDLEGFEDLEISDLVDLARLQDLEISRILEDSRVSDLESRFSILDSLGIRKESLGILRHH